MSVPRNLTNSFTKAGIAEFVKHLNKNKSVLHTHPIHLDREATIAIRWPSK
jgi:DNA gyrase/topoisomerase IV subunit B